MAILLIILLLIASCLFFRGKIYREEVAIVDDIYFGMTPSEVESILGEPYEEEEETPPVSGVNYLYQHFRMTFFDHEAILIARYIPIRNEFRLQYCSVECFDVEEPDAFCSIVKDALQNKLAEADGLQEQVTSSGFSLNLNRGPVGTSYLVSAGEQTVTIVCECTEFYR